MKTVWITYESDGYNNRQVEKVFESEVDATRWIINNKFAGNDYYKNKKYSELSILAEEYIEEHEVCD